MTLEYLAVRDQSTFWSDRVISGNSLTDHGCESTGEVRVCTAEFLSGDEVREEVRSISPSLVDAFHPRVLYVKIDDPYSLFLLLETDLPAPSAVTEVPSQDPIQGRDEEGDTWTLRSLP